VPSLIDNIVFVKEGEKNKSRSSLPSGLLRKANDWVVRADLSDNYSFPFFIAPTSLRPDVIIFSKKSKRVIIIELTCPCEENFEDRHSQKLSKYSALVAKIKDNSWSVDLFAIEVGARGYGGKSV